jgi:hypothetical protein
LAQSGSKACGMIYGAVAAAISVCLAACSEQPAVVPDLSGMWAREYIGFDPPASGPGPITNRSRIPTGQSNLNEIVGDYGNPILKPAAAEAVKLRGNIALSGTVAPDGFNQCTPLQAPFIFYQQQFQLLQQKDEVVILYMFDHHVRRIRMNEQHPATVIPSWSGDSIGRYEGDALVVDTVGLKVGPLAMVDMFGTPQSEALHVVERYRLIDFEAALEAEKRSDKEHIHILPDFATNDGVAVDPDYTGRAL